MGGSLGRVGGVRRGRWPLLGWRGGFDPVQFTAIAEVLGRSQSAFPQELKKPRIKTQHLFVTHMLLRVGLEGTLILVVP